MNKVFGGLTNLKWDKTKYFKGSGDNKMKSFVFSLTEGK